MELHQNQTRPTHVQDEGVSPHINSRLDHPAYIAEGMLRIKVPDEKISWEVPFPEYDLAEQDPYTHSAVTTEWEKNGSNGWASPPDGAVTAETVTSFYGDIPTSEDGRVLNPSGRTGIKEGRGLLGKFGANFAVDPIIFRKNPDTQELELLLIQRGDTGQWALPGGMVDDGESVFETLTRELKEETSLSLSMDDAEIVYQGYVDGTRSTDRAWIETTAAFKLLNEEESRSAQVKGGDDAADAKWFPINGDLLPTLYASHAHFVGLALKRIESERLDSFF